MLKIRANLPEWILMKAELEKMIKQHNEGMEGADSWEKVLRLQERNKVCKHILDWELKTDAQD